MGRLPRRSKEELLKDQIVKKEEEIAKYQAAIDKAVEEKESFENELKSIKLEALAAELDKRGLTVDQVLQNIDNGVANE